MLETTGLKRIRAVRAVLADSRHGVDLDGRVAELVSGGSRTLAD